MAESLKWESGGHHRGRIWIWKSYGGVICQGGPGNLS